MGLVPLSLGVSLESGGLVLGVRSEAVSLSCPEARDVRLSQCWQWELISQKWRPLAAAPESYCFPFPIRRTSGEIPHKQLVQNFSI